MSYFLLPLSPDDREIMGRSSTIYGFDPLVTFADVMINFGNTTSYWLGGTPRSCQLLIYVLGWYFTTQISHIIKSTLRSDVYNTVRALLLFENVSALFSNNGYFLRYIYVDTVTKPMLKC